MAKVCRNMKYSSIGRLSVASKLLSFINSDLIPGTGVNPEKFWKEFDDAVHELAPENKKLLSEQAPPKEIKKEEKKQVKLENQKDEIDLSKSKKVPTPETKQEKVKLEKSESVPLPDKKIEKLESKQETEQQPSKEDKKLVVEKEKRKKIEKKIENDDVIKEFARIKNPFRRRPMLGWIPTNRNEKERW